VWVFTSLVYVWVFTYLVYVRMFTLWYMYGCLIICKALTVGQLQSTRIFLVSKQLVLYL